MEMDDQHLSVQHVVGAVELSTCHKNSNALTRRSGLRPGRLFKFVFIRYAGRLSSRCFVIGLPTNVLESCTFSLGQVAYSQAPQKTACMQ